ncbi:SZT2 protein [Sarcoptes scabiei]|nr:SZT2 protein [Sarcoptes scabiei]
MRLHISLNSREIQIKNIEFKTFLVQSKVSTLIRRNFNEYRYNSRQENIRNTGLTMTAIVIICLDYLIEFHILIFNPGLSYAAVPLYRIYCQKTGTGLMAQPVIEKLNKKIATMNKIEDRQIKVIFEADKSASTACDFRPTQHSIVCSPGETVLAFYTAKNILDRPVNGIATYNILPFEAAKYFHKIQCFCFEEQQLNAKEEVDLPVFFFIDPEFARDPYLFDANDIILSYNFYEINQNSK